MRKIHFLYIIFFLAIPQIVFAHTISQHLEELYGQTYLPVFIVAKLLPFIGLGMLAFNQGQGRILLKNQWIMFIGILLGIILSFLHEHLILFLIGNNVSIIFLGMLLLLISKPKKIFIKSVLMVAGISLGYEYGLNITHAMEFKWLFIGLLFIGLSIFIVLSRFRFFQKGAKSVIRISTGLFLVIAGLIVVLLT